MTLPQTYFATLILMILGMICWGSWANTFKMAGNWRFELYYFDYAIGVMLAASIAAYTFGTMGSDGFQFMDDIGQTGKRNLFLAAVAGMVFNLANMFLLAAVSVAGMAAAFAMGLGTALAVGVVWSFFLQPQGSAVLLFGGAAIVLIAVIMAAFAYRAHAAARLEEQAKAGLLKTSAPKVSPKPIILSLVSGLFMGSFLPLTERSRLQGSGLGPYALAFMFAVGVFLSTFVFSLFFMNLPVQGQPVEVRDYIRRGNVRRHLLGVTGGVIWCMGAVLYFVAGSAEQSAKVGAATSYAIGQGAAIFGVLWGIFAWGEFDGADFRAKNLLYVMLALFLCGLGMVSIASSYAK
jgi:glucose uptake protein